MSRYTLSKETNAAGLFRVLDGGVGTKAWASEKAILGDAAEIKAGRFRGGEFLGGEFFGGKFFGGEFLGGEFLGGAFFGGEFLGGGFYGGAFHGGAFYGGAFYGGAFRGGEFLEGRFLEGEFHEGWLPLQIQGSKHFVNIPDGKRIQIGCKSYSPALWLSKYEQIGLEEGYTPTQVEEYRRYIELATAAIEAHKASTTD